MGDYWRDGRPLGAPASAKRARNDLGIAGGREISGYLPEMAGRSYLHESNLSGALDAHARNGLSLYSSGGLTSSEINSMGGSLGTRLGNNAGYLSGSPILDPVMMSQRQGIASMDPGFGGKTGGGMGLSYQRPDTQALREPPRRPDDQLPPDASNTLFVEGLPTDCTRREAAHVFRPFIGFKEVRLVQKEPKRPGGEPLVLCFVDFADARCAATALEALQGYKFDETDRDSSGLKLQFARFPGPRGPSGSARDEYRGNRDRDDARTRFRR